MADDELVAVFSSENEVEASLYQCMLEEAGIPVMVRNLTDIWGQRSGIFNTQPQPRVTVFVSARDAAQARALVEDFRHQAASGALRIGEHDAPPPLDDAHVEGARRAELVILSAVLLGLLVLAVLAIVLNVLDGRFEPRLP